ncbi:MAG: sigma 54-interacting transcriptional regulator [Deltaproteobacteria bacterium]|nr:sigma 54-interacting transcriptional regulator [Deltaproteobacteria bacterium]
MPPSDPRPSALQPLGTIPHLVEHVAIPRLEVVVEREGERATGRTMQLDGGTLRVGTHPSNEIVLSDPTVSRFHCRFTLENQICRVQDLGSLNGTWLQTGPNEPIRIRDADVAPNTSVRVGSSILHVRTVAPASDDEVPPWPAFGSLLGTSLAMRKLFSVLEKIAKAECNVLIQGESGVGKELVAAEIVQHSPRRDSPFVVVDCGAISPNLVESQLFGHARGAFTGADRDRTGAFEAASGGTIFLDEIGELAMDLQPKLLRVIENQEVRRLGETHSRKVDVRVIAATNRDLEREVNKGRFREDLFFRLSVVTVTVPPLRERKADIELLIGHFLEQLSATRNADRLFTKEVIAELAQHDWPGNVRELRNYVERAVVLETTSLRPPSTPRMAAVTDASGANMAVRAIDINVPFKIAKEGLIDEFERAYLQSLLGWAGGNMSKAARHAGIDRMYLHRLVQRHGLRAK